MPALGEIKFSRELGYTSQTTRHIWAACIDCGKERWVRCLNGKPAAEKCMSCTQKKFTPEERFWSYVNKTDSCWLWTGCMRSLNNKHNYGMFTINHDIIVAAHRYSYILTYGEISDNVMVLHKCDNPPCVRPDHLFLGTQKDNIQDAVNKGKMQGELSSQAIITNEQAIEMKIRYNKGETIASIHRDFNFVHVTTVGRICHDETWNCLSLTKDNSNYWDAHCKSLSEEVKL